MKIGRHHINEERVYVIAEIGNNHNGDFNRAIKMIDEAIEACADCVKFQMRHLEEVYRKKTLVKDGEDLGTEYVIDLLNRFELSKDQHVKLFEYAKSKNITYLCTPWDIESVKFLERLGVEAYKVASADLTNLPLIKTLIDTGKPLILSTGMSLEIEIKKTVDFLNTHNAKFFLLHCNSTYPAHAEINSSFRFRSELKSIYKSLLPLVVLGMLIVYFLREFIVLTIYNEAFWSMTLLFKWQLLADFIRFIANVMSFKFLAKKQISYFIYTQLLGLLLYHVLGHHLIETYKTEGVVIGLFVSNLIYLGSVMTVLRHDLFGFSLRPSLSSEKTSPSKAQNL